MSFLPLLGEVKSFARAIHKFQHDTGNKKTSCINSALQDFVDYVTATELKDLPLLDVFKKKTRAARSGSSRFYNTSWFIDIDKFPRAVARFGKIFANSQIRISSI